MDDIFTRALYLSNLHEAPPSHLSFAVTGLVAFPLAAHSPLHGYAYTLLGAVSPAMIIKLLVAHRLRLETGIS